MSKIDKPALAADTDLTGFAVGVRRTALPADSLHAHLAGQTVARGKTDLLAFIIRAPLALRAVHPAQADHFADVPDALTAQSALAVVVAYVVRPHARLFRHGVRPETLVARAHHVVVDGGAFRIYPAHAVAFTRI